MRTTSFVLPLSAALLLGTAAYAQNADQPMNNTQPANSPQAQPMTNPPAYGEPANGQMNEQPGAADQNNGMNNATMYGASAEQMDPRQNRAGGMPIDQETTVNGVQAACTGVGNEQEDRARWSSYPVKLVVAGDHGQYFAGEHVSVTQHGQQIADMTCNGPWVLMKLDPGSYHATVDLPGHAAKDISFTAPASGQHEVTVHFASTDEDFGGNNRNRATPTSFQQPNSAPAPTEQNNNTAPQNMPPPNTNENNNSDQNPQAPQ